VSLVEVVAAAKLEPRREELITFARVVPDAVVLVDELANDALFETHAWASDGLEVGDVRHGDDHVERGDNDVRPVGFETVAFDAFITPAKLATATLLAAISEGRKLHPGPSWGSPIQTVPSELTNS
jgi:hypothetical protein